MSMAIKLGKMVIYFDGLLPIKSRDFLFTWSSEITWQTKIIISSRPQCLWSPNFSKTTTYLDKLQPNTVHDPDLLFLCNIYVIVVKHFNHIFFFISKIICLS